MSGSDTRPPTEPYRWRYYATAALRCGVPRMWLEDAAQDIALACWGAGAETPTIVHRAAVDAARRYGAYRQYGERRTYAPVLVPLEGVRKASSDGLTERDELMDVERAYSMLRPQYQAEICRQLAIGGGGRRTMADYKRGQHARARLRQLCE